MSAARAGLSLSLLDSYYSSYPNAGATPLLVAQGQPIFDLTDHRTRYAPKYSGNANLGYATDVGAYRLDINADVFFSGAYNYSNNDDPRLQQKSYVTLDLNAGLAHPASGWKISVIGKNLTNRTIGVLGTSVPNTPGSYSVGREPPRSVSLQAKIDF
jgi:iron complex outermembrane recepter protein